MNDPKGKGFNRRLLINLRITQGCDTKIFPDSSKCKMTRKFIRMCEPIFFEYRFVKQVLDILTVIVSFSSFL